jgi:hypothetical protein
LYLLAAGSGFSPKEKTGDALWRAVVNSLKKREWSEDKLAKVERLWNELNVLWPELHGSVLALCSLLKHSMFDLSMLAQERASNGSSSTLRWFLRYGSEECAVS